MRIDEIEHGHVVQNWTPGPHFAMPDGFVQGGLFCTIADISQGVAMLTTPDQFENWATLDFHIPSCAWYASARWCALRAQ